MKIMDVEIHLPRRNDLPGMATISAVYIIAALLTHAAGVFSPTTIGMFLIGALSGPLSAACGCSIEKHGVRGAILVLGLCLAMLVLFAGIYSLGKFF